MKTIAILLAKKFAGTDFRMKLTANYSPTNHIYPFKCVQTNELMLNQNTVILQYLKSFNCVQKNEIWIILKCYIKTLSINIIFGLFGFYGIPTLVGYLMLNHLYTYTLNIYDLACLGFMAYQPL